MYMYIYIYVYVYVYLYVYVCMYTYIYIYIYYTTTRGSDGLLDASLAGRRAGFPDLIRSMWGSCCAVSCMEPTTALGSHQKGVVLCRGDMWREWWQLGQRAQKSWFKGWRPEQTGQMGQTGAEVGWMPEACVRDLRACRSSTSAAASRSRMLSAEGQGGMVSLSEGRQARA